MDGTVSISRTVALYSITYLLHLFMGILSGVFLSLPVILVLFVTGGSGLDFLLPAIAGYAVLDSAFRTRNAIARNQQFFVPWELLNIPTGTLAWFVLLAFVFATITFGIATSAGLILSQIFGAPVIGFLLAVSYPYLELTHGGPRRSPAWIVLEASLIALQALGVAGRITLGTFVGLFPLNRRRGGSIG